jgi:hypothetical protein
MALAPEQRINLLRDAMKVSNNWWVDILTSKSIARERIDMSFEEVLEKIGDRTYFTFILRYPPTKEEPYLEVGFRTMCSLPYEYFLWIHCDLNHSIDLIREYQLKRFT